MTTKGFRDGFLSKLAAYNVDPKAIFGDISLDGSQHSNGDTPKFYDLNPSYDIPSDAIPNFRNSTNNFDISSWLENNPIASSILNSIYTRRVLGNNKFSLSMRRRF